MATMDDLQIIDTAKPSRPWRLTMRPDPASTLDVGDALTGREVRILFWLPVMPLVFLAYPIVWLVQTPLSPPRMAIAVAGLCAFVVIHLRTTFRVIASYTRTAARRPPWIALAVQLALACGLGLAFGLSFFGLLIKTGGDIGLALPIRAALKGIAGVTALTIAIGFVTGSGGSATAQMAAITMSVGLVTLSVGGLLETNRKLRAAREENARLAVAEAVAEERLRFARDLHDLLGHSLSLIVLKSELAGRLQRVDAERATGEIRDVEGVAREALREVREAVAGYRQPTLATELPGARIMLAAAGIACDVDDAAGDLPPAIDAILAWTVREGVTNVIRHSHARHCTIRVTCADDMASVAVADDGSGVRTLIPDATGNSGSGLAGLAERAAAHGGGCEAATRAGGGFRLFVSLPVNESSALSLS